MELTLVQEQDLIGLTNPWPLKDAAPVWEQLKTMRVKDFNILVVGYLSNLRWRSKRGRNSDIEKLAKTILFKMSEKQRLYTYKLISKRAESIISRGWWKEDIKDLIQQTTKVDIDRRTHRQTSFTHRLLDKKKVVYEDRIERTKFKELTSVLDPNYKEWLITFVVTEDGRDYVTEYKFKDYQEASNYFYQ